MTQVVNAHTIAQRSRARCVLPRCLLVRYRAACFALRRCFFCAPGLALLHSGAGAFALPRCRAFLNHRSQIHTPPSVSVSGKIYVPPAVGVPVRVDGVLSVPSVDSHWVTGLGRWIEAEYSCLGPGGREVQSTPARDPSVFRPGDPQLAASRRSLINLGFPRRMRAAGVPLCDSSPRGPCQVSCSDVHRPNRATYHGACQRDMSS